MVGWSLFCLNHEYEAMWQSSDSLVSLSPLDMKTGPPRQQEGSSHTGVIAGVVAAVVLLLALTLLALYTNSHPSVASPLYFTQVSTTDPAPFLNQLCLLQRRFIFVWQSCLMEFFSSFSITLMCIFSCVLYFHSHATTTGHPWSSESRDSNPVMQRSRLTVMRKRALSKLGSAEGTRNWI